MFYNQSLFSLYFAVIDFINYSQSPGFIAQLAFIGKKTHTLHMLI